MPTFYVDEIDIDVDEFISACSPKEKEELINALIEDGHINRAKLDSKPRVSAAEEIFEEHLDALHGNWNRLSADEETIIINIAQKFIYENKK